MSHYVTLPSNGSDLQTKNGLRNNTQSDFSIDLKVPLVFPYKAYEVGLSEVSYKKNWIVDLGKFTVIDNDQNLILLETNIYTMDGISMKYVIAVIDSALNNFPKKKLYGKIAFNLDLNGKLEFEIPENISIKIEGYFVSVISSRSAANLLKYRVCMDINEQEQTKNINQTCLTLLGTKAGEKSVCYIMADYLRVVEHLYIYTNIIDNVHVGSEMIKLLKTMPVKSKFNEIVSDVFDFPQYLPLDSGYIDRIRMFICDCEGNKLKFADNYSSVVYKLHFRPKAYSVC